MSDAHGGSATVWLMLLLGAYHGVNPAMGWLFAVARGMQEQSEREVARSLVPIALGHALAIGAVVAAAIALGSALPVAAIRYVVAAMLVGLGVFRMLRHRHPRWVRMQVGFGDLTLWSFLMASAHGAGLMLVPLLLGGSTVEAAAPNGMHHHALALAGPRLGLIATAVHTGGYLGVTSLVAWTVYRKVGLRVLRTAWFNVDLIWAGALVLTGVLTLSM